MNPLKLDFEGRRAISVFLVENAVENETHVASAEQVDQILTLTSTLVADQVGIRMFCCGVITTDNFIIVVISYGWADIARSCTIEAGR